MLTLACIMLGLRTIGLLAIVITDKTPAGRLGAAIVAGCSATSTWAVGSLL